MPPKSVVVSALVVSGIVGVVVVAVVIGLLVGTGAAMPVEQKQNSPLEAVAVFNVKQPESTHIVVGYVTFRQEGDTVTFNVNVTGLPPDSFHGFHIHESGDVRGHCGSTGGHYNPAGVTHGFPNETTRHNGDLGNIQANGQGMVSVESTDRIISLTGEHSIIGRAVVIHEQRDMGGDMGSGGSPTTGNAGGRVCCGVIGVINK